MVLLFDALEVSTFMTCLSFVPHVLCAVIEWAAFPEIEHVYI